MLGIFILFHFYCFSFQFFTPPHPLKHLTEKCWIVQTHSSPQPLAPSLYLIIFLGAIVQFPLPIHWFSLQSHSLCYWNWSVGFKCLAIWFPRALCVSASHIYFQAPFCLHITFPLLWILLTSVQLLWFLIHDVHLCMRKMLYALLASFASFCPTRGRYLSLVD